MSEDEFAAFRDVFLDRTIQPMEANLRVLGLINRDADLYHWWRAFIDGPMGHVPIGSEEFRQSRAGLIHHTYMNSIRLTANLSPVDFKALSLAEVFDVIEALHMRETNARNAANHKNGAIAGADGTKTEVQVSPLNLRQCDVPQTLKRDGYLKPVTIQNLEHWRLMEALMAAYPKAVPETKLRQIVQGPNDRDNYRRALNNKIDDLGLTIENWVLIDVKNRP